MVDEFEVWTHNLSAARSALHNISINAKREAETWTHAANAHHELWASYQQVAADIPDESGMGIPTNQEVLKRIEFGVQSTENFKQTAIVAGQDLQISVAKHVQAARTELSTLQASFTTRLQRHRDWEKAAKHAASGNGTQEVADGARDRYESACKKLKSVVPQFLAAFDEFLKRLATEILQLHVHLLMKHRALLRDFVARFSESDPTRPLVEQWREQFQRIMPAVEAMNLLAGERRSSTHPHLKEVREHVTTIPEPIKDNRWFQWLGGEGRIETFKWHKLHRDAGAFWTPDWKPTPSTRGMERRGSAASSTLAFVIAAYDYDAEDSSELSLRKGDRIKVLDQGTVDDPNWWNGILHGRQGLFPRNFVVNEDGNPLGVSPEPQEKDREGDGITLQEERSEDGPVDELNHAHIWEETRGKSVTPPPQPEHPPALPMRPVTSGSFNGENTHASLSEHGDEEEFNDFQEATSPKSGQQAGSTSPEHLDKSLESVVPEATIPKEMIPQSDSPGRESQELDITELEAPRRGSQEPESVEIKPLEEKLPEMVPPGSPSLGSKLPEPESPGLEPRDTQLVAEKAAAAIDSSSIVNSSDTKDSDMSKATLSSAKLASGEEEEGQDFKFTDTVDASPSDPAYKYSQDTTNDALSRTDSTRHPMEEEATSVPLSEQIE